jgi:hypothetical protein
MSVVLTKEDRWSDRKPDTKCFECLRSLTYPFAQWNNYCEKLCFV